MKLTVTTTSQNLRNDILTPTQITQIEKTKDWKQASQIIFQNLGTVNLHFSFGSTAIIWSSIKIIPEAFLTFDAIDLANINIISETSTNTDVILEGN